jgi:uncharacterized protein YycO
MLEFRIVNWTHNIRAMLNAPQFRVANTGKGMRHRSFIKYGLLTFLVVLLSTCFILRHRVAMTAQLWLASRAISDLELNDGDLIFQTSRSSQSAAVQHATGSIWSHMGMIVLRNDQPFVLEASATVRYTPVARWVVYGVGRHFVIKRLADANKVLTPEAVARLDAVGAGFLGLNYDTTFEWSDDRMYCSELVWKIYDRALGIEIGKLQKIRDFNLTDTTVAKLMEQRYGNAVPMDEPVISPVSMFDSPLLVQVVAR